VKVLFVINDLARAGAEKQVTLLACGLKALGWSVSIVLIKQRNDFAEVLSAAGIPVLPLHRHGPLDLGTLSRLRAAIQRLSPDVVVSFLFLSNLLTVLASRRLRPRPRIVVSVRESYRHNLAAPLRLIGRLVHRSADLVLFNSTGVLREEGPGFPRISSVACLPNAVVSKSVEAIDWRRVGVEGEPIVVSLGQLTPVKGHRLLIEAFARARKAAPRAQLVLVGDGSEKERLQTLVRTRGLADHVTFLGHQPEPLPFIAGADVFVQPSLSEGMSNALMEAMALRSCIVATRVGAASELLEDGVQALLSEPSIPGLANAMERVFGDAALRIRLAEAAGKRAENFSIDRVASGLDAILQGVVRRTPPG
jgi:glycosyltransferase involved in cell wall biosynthesis